MKLNHPNPGQLPITVSGVACEFSLSSVKILFDMYLIEFVSVYAESEIYIKAKRTLSLAVNYKPIIKAYLEGGGEASTQVGWTDDAMIEWIKKKEKKD